MAMATTPPQHAGNPQKGHVMSKEQLWQEFLPHHPQWCDYRFNKRSPILPDLTQKHKNEVLWSEGVSNPHWVNSELSGQGGAQSGDGSVNAALSQEYTWMGLNQAQLGGEHLIGNRDVSEREGVNGDSFGTCEQVRMLCKAGQLNEAVNVLNQEGIHADSSTYVFVLKECSNMKDLSKGKQVHAHIIQCGFKPNIFLHNTLVNMYAKCGSVEDARQVFERMLERNLFTWTIMITACAKHGRGREALEIYDQMQREGVTPDKVMFIPVLKACASLGALEKSKAVHSDMIKAGIVPDIILETALVDMYAKCRSVEDARQVFNDMAKRDVISWNAMIAGYAQHGCGREALEIYERMLWEGATPNKVTFICVLNACASLGALEKGIEVHADIRKSGIVPDTILGNTLVDMYAKCGSLKDARQVFDHMSRRDVVSWNSMIAGYAQHGCGGDAFEIYEQMTLGGLMPNKVTFICLLTACASLGALEKGKEVHAEITKAGIVPDVILQTAVADMYAKCGSVKDARQVFDKMAERDIVSWNAIMAGYSQNGYGRETFQFYEQMIQGGVTPNKVTFISVLNACASLGALEKGKEVHADIIKSGIKPDIILESTLVDMYAKCRSIKDARLVFDKMAQRNVVSWNAMIAGYAQHGYSMEAFQMYEQMIQEGVMPNRVTFICVLNACASLAALEKGKEVHANIVKAGLVPEIVVETALVDMYAKCGSVKDARDVFDNMAQRDVVSWSAMIAGYGQHGCGREALEIYEQMILERVMPDKVTFICILNACASLSALGKGKEVHADITAAGIAPDTILETALVDMYAKCGRMQDARQVFDNMAQHDVVSWNAMISGYGQHGCGREVLQLFEHMQEEGLNPNGVTFICLLSACSHGGLLDEGRHYFDSMSRCYGISPAVEHFGCMVDLLGRGGQLDEAEDFIKKMPIKPDASVWGALLGACRIHGDVVVAERAANRLLESDQQHAPTYVLLSNIYAAAGRWEDKAKIRKMMEDTSVRNKPGRSAIEINNQIHTFVAEDKLHPHIEKIHVELKRLSELMKEAGYMPDTSFVLHDVE